MQLKSKDEINQNFIFRVGELHVEMHFLDAIGSYIDGSGLDQAIVEAGITGPGTLERIKDGKDKQRALDTHYALYLTLFRYYVEFLIKQNPMIKDVEDIVQRYNILTDKSLTNSELLRYTKVDLVNCLSNCGFPSTAEIDAAIGKQGKIYRNYMKMFEALLLYIRATRQRLWDLHLASTHNLAKYFFVHDKHNYARMIPVYLAEMISLKDNDPDTWNFFEDGNFSVNKTKISFSAIGCDHAIEHENRAMKVAGGITGIYMILNY